MQLSFGIVDSLLGILHPMMSAVRFFCPALAGCEISISALFFRMLWTMRSMRAVQGDGRKRRLVYPCGRACQGEFSFNRSGE